MLDPSSALVQLRVGQVGSSRSAANLLFTSLSEHNLTCRTYDLGSYCSSKGNETIPYSGKTSAKSA